MKRSLKESRDYVVTIDNGGNDCMDKQGKQSPQPLKANIEKQATSSSSTDATDGSSSLTTAGPCSSNIISPDATPLLSATYENGCHDTIVDDSENDVPSPATALGGYHNAVTLVFEKAPLHKAPRLHKERPDRVEWIRQGLQNEGLLDKCHVLQDYESRNIECDKRTGSRNQKRQRTTVQENVFEMVQKVHSPGFVKRMQKLKDFAGCLKEEAHQYDSVYLTPHSWTSALQSVSSLCKLVDHILLPMGEIELSKFSLPSNKKPVRFGFACIRPPGHHASSSLANGYCLINHVAVAATYALEYFGGRFGDAELVQDESPKSSPKNSYPFLRNPKPQRRVAILDWDIHHGDGTQSIFWNDPNVLFCSIHAQKAFPFVSGSSAKSVGGPNAFGRTVNVAWTSHGMGDNEYVYALQTLILPILQEFQPTLILISAGFDAATGDSYCGNLSPVNGFGRMTTEILRVATEMDCPVIASLEGGYKQSVLVPCVASVVQSMVAFGEESIMTRNESDERNFLKGFANDALVGTTSSINHAITGSIASSIDGVCPTAVKNIEATRAAQQQFWKCLSVNHLKQER